MKKCYYIVDTFNKTRLPGYHIRLEAAQNRKGKFEKMTRPGRFIVCDALVNHMKLPQEAQKVIGMWPVSAFKKDSLGKFDY